MLGTLSLLRPRALSFLQNERGVVAWEYLLVIGGISMALITAVAVGPASLATQVVTAACSAIDTVIPVTLTC